MPRWSIRRFSSAADLRIAIGGGALVVVGIAGWITAQAAPAAEPETETDRAPSLHQPQKTGGQVLNAR